MDLSSFGFLKYAQAEQRHDILQPLFSRKAVTNLQSLVQNNVCPSYPARSASVK